MNDNTAGERIRANMHDLQAGFLEKVIARLDDENTRGIALTGSFARGEGGKYSDVDLWHFVWKVPKGDFQTARLELIDGHLVSIKTLLIEKDQRDLRKPERAIWAAGGWRQAKILVDKDGSLRAVQEAARNLRWERLQRAADRFASNHLAGSAEEIYKLLDGLAKRDESKTLYAIWSLTQDMAEVVLVQRGGLLPTENVFIERAQECAGKDSEWTRQFRRAIGLDRMRTGEPAFIGYGKAGLALYRETVKLLQSIVMPEDLPVVEQALAIMWEAGY